jgi:glutaredoxin 3
VFSKPWCPYCQKALEALTAEGVRSSDKIHVVDLTRYETSRNIQDTLKSFTGRHSVPNVFVGGKSIGGGDETVTLHQQGKLKEILLKAGAVM